MTSPNDPRVTRALEAYYADSDRIPALAQTEYLRGMMARALDAADKPLPVRDVSRGTKGTQVQRVTFDEVPIMPLPDVSRETLGSDFTRAVLNAWESSASRETLSEPNALERLRNWRRRAR